MNQADISRYLNLAGLLLGFAGTLVVWCNSAPAGGQVTVYMSPEMRKDVEQRGAVARYWLRIGLLLLAAGFALQFAGEIL